MGKARSRKHKKRAFKLVTGERPGDMMDTHDAKYLLNESIEQVLQTAKDIQHDTERMEIERKERDVKDRFLAG